MKVKISGKVALVTGASRGIGEAIVRSLMDEDVFVIATARDKDRLDNVVKAMPSRSKGIIGIPADLSRPGEVKRLCDEVKQKYGGVDIIVNNAGVLHFDLLSELTDDLLLESFSVNAIAPIQICRELTPGMISKKWGRIINICSSSAYFGGGTPRHCVYSSTKHALLGFSRALDEELRTFNIRVGTVSPAGVTTDMIKDRSDLDPATFMSPEDVAEAVNYLVTADGPGIVYELRMWRMKR